VTLLRSLPGLALGSIAEHFLAAQGATFYGCLKSTSSQWDEEPLDAPPCAVLIQQRSLLHRVEAATECGGERRRGL
jgi:hypothetical protein